jgi:pilus assembly protein Flp/PilA
VFPLTALTVLRARSSDERGASLIEYAFLVVLIAIVCLLAVTFFGGATSAKFSTSASALP